MCTQTLLLESKSDDCSNLSTEQNQSARRSIVQPLTMSGNVVKKEVETYNNLNRNIASQEIKKIILVTPNDSDVLGGRGNGVAFHPGNLNFRNLLKQYQAQYLNSMASTSKKRAIVMNIMEKVKSSGGRFLKLVENDGFGGWVCMTFEESRNKTAQAIRDGSPMTLKNQLKCRKQLKYKKQMKSKKQFKPDNHCFNPSNKPSEVCDGRPSKKSIQDEISSEMVNSFNKKIDRIRGDMNELKRKYDQLDREQHRLTKEFMKKIIPENSTDIL